MSYRNPTLVLVNTKINFSCNSCVTQAVPKTTRTVGLSNGNLYKIGNVCFLRMIQTSQTRQRLCRAPSAKSNHKNSQLEDYWHSLGTSESSQDHQRSIESYLMKVESETEQSNENISQTEDAKTTNKTQLPSFNKQTPDGRTRSFVGSRRRRNENLSTKSTMSFANDEGSNHYLVSVLASIDIAVFLFDVASPIKNSYYNLYSLPLMYGAKVNELILVGERWRLVTPMFLHSGVFHVVLSIWVLLDFGPHVCKIYGSFTFFFVFLLGGISSNLMSFLHTPDATVGGSGPVFAIIGAWLVYQLQNKDMITKEVSEKMFQKAAIATVLSFGIVNFGLIDSWTYLSAAVTGITYGYLTCPTLQLDDPLSKTTREEGIAVVGQLANPCKSLGVFVMFILVFSSLLYLIDPPLEMPQLERLPEMPQLENLLEFVE